MAIVLTASGKMAMSVEQNTSPVGASKKFKISATGTISRSQNSWFAPSILLAARER